MAEMRKITSYFSQFDGTGKSWSEVEPFFAALFHKDCSIVSVAKDGSETQNTYDEWSKRVRVSLEKKVEVEMLKVEKVPEGVKSTLSMIMPDCAPVVFSTLGVFLDGQLISAPPATTD
jgi:hypothetical protein